jgi:hypothetical protein
MYPDAAHVPLLMMKNRGCRTARPKWPHVEVVACRSDRVSGDAIK